MVMDRAGLAEFLRTRRTALQPEDVGVLRGVRRRTAGLRREEVAALAGMSVDYYGRLEQQRGPQPSPQMTAAIARGLQLSQDERDHLFRLCGHFAPPRGSLTDHVSAGMMRILDRLDDTPAQVLSPLAETLVQTRLAVALLGDQTSYRGLERSMYYRWFTDPAARSRYPAADHPQHSRIFTSGLRVAATQAGRRSRAAEIVSALLARSPEFAALWPEHQIGLQHSDSKRILHQEIGEITVHCQVLADPDTAQRLLVYTAPAGTEDGEKLQLLSVIGTQRISGAAPAPSHGPT